METASQITEQITDKKMKLKLAPPWITYRERLKALFEKDPGVTVGDIEKRPYGLKLTIRVESAAKADALTRLMDREVCFGDVALEVKIVPANAGEGLPDDARGIAVVMAAFDGNAAVTVIRAVSKGLFHDMTYVVFRREVVQYPADNLGDVNGSESTLMETIAREMLPRADGVFFCTSNGGPALGQALDKPLGEWP